MQYLFCKYLVFWILVRSNLLKVQLQKLRQTFKMAQNTQSQLSLSSILLNKIKYFRSAFTQLGYSQHEFQLYFSIHILGATIDQTSNISNLLIQQIKILNTKQKLEKVLRILDQEEQVINFMIKDKQNCQGQSKQKLVLQEGQKQLKRKKSSKESKKTKKHRGQDRKKSQDSKKDLTTQFLSLVMSSQGQIQALSNQNGENQKQQREKQLILQKLLEIQMLNRILCGSSDNKEGRLQDFGYFMMRC